jgi:hypothetical protein
MDALHHRHYCARQADPRRQSPVPREPRCLPSPSHQSRGGSRQLAMIRRQEIRQRVNLARRVKNQPARGDQADHRPADSIIASKRHRTPQGSIPGLLTDSGPARPCSPLRPATRATSLPPARSRDRSLHARWHPGANRSRHHDERPTPMPTRWPVALNATAGERPRPRRAVSEPSRSSTDLPRSTLRSSSTDTYPDSVT